MRRGSKTGTSSLQCLCRPRNNEWWMKNEHYENTRKSSLSPALFVKPLLLRYSHVLPYKLLTGLILDPSTAVRTSVSSAFFLPPFLSLPPPTPPFVDASNLLPKASSCCSDPVRSTPASRPRRARPSDGNPMPTNGGDNPSRRCWGCLSAGSRCATAPWLCKQQQHRQILHRTVIAHQEDQFFWSA